MVWLSIDAGAMMTKEYIIRHFIVIFTVLLVQPVVIFAQSVGQQEEFNNILDTGARMTNNGSSDAIHVLREALFLAKSNEQYQRVYDQMGILAGVEAKYWEAFGLFFKAYNYKPDGVLKGLTFPQDSTQAVALCASKAAAAEFSLKQAEQEIRKSMNLSPNDNIDLELRSALFSGHWGCPKFKKKVVKPKASTTDPTPPVNPVKKRRRGLPTATWVSGAVSLAAVGTGVTLGLLTLDAADGISRGDNPEDAQLLAGLTTASFATAGGTALLAILFAVIQKDKTPSKNTPKSSSAMVSGQGFSVQF